MPNDERQPIPALASNFMEALNGRRLRLKEPPNRGPMLVAYVVLHRRAARAIKLAVDAVEAEEERRRKEGIDQSTKGNPDFALDAFLDAVYRVAELFEFYSKHIPEYIPSIRGIDRKKRKNYVNDIEILAKLWRILCNQCKHNHAFLVPVEGMYEDKEWVTGFSLYSKKGDFFVVNPDVHTESDVHSYNWQLRALIGDLLGADLRAAQAINELPDLHDVPPVESYGIILTYSPEIFRVLDRPRLSMPREDKVATRAIAVFGQELRIGDCLGIERGAGRFQMRFIMDTPGVGVSVNVVAPYGAPVLRDLTLHTKPRAPLAVLLRHQFEGLIVEPN